MEARLTGDLQRALERIPERQRAALLLAELHDLTGLELAAALGVSHVAARALLTRARESLRQALAVEQAADAQREAEPMPRGRGGSASEPGSRSWLAGHQRARELAAARIDELLAPRRRSLARGPPRRCARPAPWSPRSTTRHHDLFAALRAATPEPPRDLWARTSAGIDASAESAAPAEPAPGAACVAPGRPLALGSGGGPVALLAVGGRRRHGPPRREARPEPTARHGRCRNSRSAIQGAADLQVLALDGAGNLRAAEPPGWTRSARPASPRVCGVFGPPSGRHPLFSAFGSSADLLRCAHMSPLGSPWSSSGAIQPGAKGVYVVPVKTTSRALPPRGRAPRGDRGDGAPARPRPHVRQARSPRRAPVRHRPPSASPVEASTRKPSPSIRSARRHVCGLGSRPRRPATSRPRPPAAPGPTTAPPPDD